MKPQKVSLKKLNLKKVTVSDLKATKGGWYPTIFTPCEHDQETDGNDTWACYTQALCGNTTTGPEYPC